MVEILRQKVINGASQNNFFPGLTYVPGERSLYKLHPMSKLLLLLCFSITVFSFEDHWTQFFLLGLLLVGYSTTGLGLGFFWRKLRTILIFGGIIFAVQALFVRGGHPVFSYTLGKVTITLWSWGMARGLAIAFRFLNIIGSSYLFVATTDPNDLAYALMQAGLPYRWGFMLITALRFIPVFQWELARIRSAQMAKGIDLSTAKPNNWIPFVRYLFIPLVISTLGKVDSLTISMEGRAFGLYSTRTYRRQQTFSSYDWVLVAVAPLVCLGAFILFR